MAAATRAAAALVVGVDPAVEAGTARRAVVAVGASARVAGDAFVGAR